MMMVMVMLMMIADPPEVTAVEPSSVADGFAQLICVVSGVDPPDNITWTFGGTLVYLTTQKTGANITLDITRFHFGVYTCTAANEFGSDSSSVSIMSPGMLFTQSHGAFNLCISEMFRLSCKSVGSTHTRSQS